MKKKTTGLFRLSALVFASAMIFVSCKKNETEQATPAGIQATESGWGKLSPLDQQKILGDTAMQNHTDLNWERIKNNPVSSLAASYYIDRCKIGEPYIETYMGQTSPGQGNSNSCQSFAAAVAHNEYVMTKFNAGKCLSTMNQNWRRSPWYIFYKSPIVNYWAVSSALNTLYYYGATHLTCMPGYNGSVFYWAPDPAFGINTLADVENKALDLKISDKSWSWVTGSNTSTTPIYGCATRNFDLAQIKNAISHNRVVLVRFAVMTTGDPIPTNGSYIWDTNDNCNKNITKYHVVAIVGYDDANSTFYCQNSWGAGGKMNVKGCFYMKYNTLQARGDQAAYINW